MEAKSLLDLALYSHNSMHDYFLKHRHYPSVAFVDIKSTYDTVDHRIIWRSLYDILDFPRPLLSLLINLFYEVLVSVLLANQSSIPFSPLTGVLQGFALSPHLYSLNINSLPGAASNTATLITIPGESHPTPLNSLLFSDDVAIFGTKNEVQQMLNIATTRSFDLGNRWNPYKCAILKAPSRTSSSFINFSFKLYGQYIPTVTQFTYLGMEFVKKKSSSPWYS